MYANGQQNAIYEQMLERKREARNVHANVKRGVSAMRRVQVTRAELAKFEAACDAIVAKREALKALRLAK